MKHKTMARLYLREAVLALALARLAVRFLPAAWILAWARRPRATSTALRSRKQYLGAVGD